uniref:Uncharacterized protein n=1 Tax=Rhizophora mucronata TaxID=61149 RepID=A0A2P2PH66_RHIMU
MKKMTKRCGDEKCF